MHTLRWKYQCTISPPVSCLTVCSRARYSYRQVRQPAVVVGTSIGGTIALDFALSHPEDVAALVLIDAQVRFESEHQAAVPP